METRGFFIGLIAAIVLFLLWENKRKQAPALPVRPTDTPGAGCSSCGPSAAAAPMAQRIVVSGGGDGFVTPGTPPLGTATGTGDTSFYGPSGPTPDTGFVHVSPVDLVPAIVVRGPLVGNTPGSPTTPADATPLRASQPVPTTSEAGFQQRYSFVGIPRTAGARNYVA